MISKKRLLFLILASLLGSPLCAQAQGTSQQIYGGHSRPVGANIFTSSRPSIAPASASRNSTGAGRTEGALGLSPQLQKEVGISRQQ
jgi:hypothetical protein